MRLSVSSSWSLQIDHSELSFVGGMPVCRPPEYVQRSVPQVRAQTQRSKHSFPLFNKLRLLRWSQLFMNVVGRHPGSIGLAARGVF
jgi:hypothetical protein